MVVVLLLNPDSEYQKGEELVELSNNRSFLKGSY